jgi:hypothetical protein
MQDDEVALLNDCLDLLTLKKNEAFPRSLLSTKAPGEWVGVRMMCADLGLSSAADLKPELYATWLADPGGARDYVVVIFYDDESKWSTTASYNRAAVSRDAASTKASVVTPVSAASTAAPAVATTPGH